MSTQIEKEARIMISKDKYLLLCSSLLKEHPGSNYINQTNYYFDNSDFELTSNHRVVRIRHAEDKYELTYKAKDIGGDLEINQTLSSIIGQKAIDNNELPKGDIYNKISSYSIQVKDLKVVASLYTKRLEINFDDYLLVIDMNQYGDITDYNLEVESNISLDHATNVIKRYCDQYQLFYKEDYTVKSARAIELARKI